MTQRWGVDGAGPSENPMEGRLRLRPPNHTNPLLIGLFRVFAWKIVLALARPVTPEVAGSSPVAPALAADPVVLFGVAASRANVTGCGSLDTHPSDPAWPSCAVASGP